MFAMSTILAILLAVSCVSCTEYGRTQADPGNGEIISLDIALDPEYMIVYPGTPNPPQDCFQHSINLHDFNRRLVAIKVVDDGVCYIKPSSETYEEVAERIHNKEPQPPIQQASEQWGVGKDVVEPEDVESRFGPLIAKFCTGYDVYTMEDGSVVKGVARRAANHCFLCWQCTVQAKKYTESQAEVVPVAIEN